MNEQVNREAEILAKAAEQDMARQRQIENQKQSINRLLDRCNAIEAKMNEALDIGNQAIAEGNASEVVHHMVNILSADIDG